MSKKGIILLGFILAKFVLQYTLISPEYDLQRDEYLHLDQANHLAWGYISVPPLTSWISVLIAYLGNSVFWVKFFPALFGALTMAVVWNAIESLRGSLAALILGANCLLFSALLRLNILYQPNSLDVLIWTSFYFVIIKYIQTNKPKWLYAAALIFAIGFLNKYNIIFLLLGLIPAVLISEHRKLLLQKHLFLSILLAFLLILPNLIWQVTNDFPVIRHLQQLADTQLIHVSRRDFLKNQLFFFFGALFVILAALYALLFNPEFKKFRFFFFLLVFTLAVFTYYKAKDYYAIGLYPIYIAFGAVYLGNLLKKGWKKYLLTTAIALPVLFFIPLSGVFFPNQSPQYIAQNAAPYQKYGLLRWEDGKDHALPQDFADMLGWKTLAEKVDSIATSLPHPEQTLILCDNYGQAGAINYYKKNRQIRANSFNADYINWFDPDMKITDVILVKEMDDEDKQRTKEIPLFEKVYLADKRINPLAREQEISIYVLRRAKIDVQKRIQEEILEKKRH